MKYYIINNKEYEEMPYWLWPDTSPITESFFIEKGGRIEEREEPPEPEDEIKSFSKLQILLHMKADFILITTNAKKGDKVFLEALTNLDLFNIWDAAACISTDYEGYEDILAAVKDEMCNIILDDNAAIWRKEGYTEQEIEDNRTRMASLFETYWKKCVEKIEKYGRI